MNSDPAVSQYREAFINQAELMFGFTTKKAVNTFAELFGCSPFVCAVIWNRLLGHYTRTSIHKGTSPLHLLWMMYYIRHYPTEAAMEITLKASRKTIRNWIWYMLSLVAPLVHYEVSCQLIVCFLFLRLIVF